MPFNEKETIKITQQVLSEYEAIQADFGHEMTVDEERAIKYAVQSALNKSLPF